MTDERRTTAVALPGDPAGWRATVRDLLRYLRAESPPREDAVRWLREAAGAADAGAADEQLAFLEAAGVVETESGRAAPGPRGREFLDTHDEGVLYEALSDAVAGFEPLLESLAVRPLTDVEFRDLLERAFDADLGSTEPVLGHRRWLQALGYVDHEDGVNDLTRAGRLRVETDDDLTPPRAAQPGPGATGDADAEPEPATGAAGTQSGAAGDTAESEPTTPGTLPGGAAGTSGGADTGDGSTGRTTDGTTTDQETADETTTDDPAAADDSLEALMRRYDHTCAVCGDRRRRGPDEGYARVFHPMPTGDAHGGPAEPDNAVVVCPNHHADLAHGLLRVDPRTLEIEHAYEAAVSGRTLATADGHRPAAQYLAYYDEVVSEL